MHTLITPWLIVGVAMMAGVPWAANREGKIKNNNSGQKPKNFDIKNIKLG
jgi:stringent starvation protein B